MGILKEIPEFRIKYSDVFSLRNLYIMLHEALIEEGWLGLKGDNDHKDIEILYAEKVFQKGIHRGGKEVWFWWRAAKNWEGKNEGYFKNFLDIDARTAYIQPMEVMHQGKKVQVHKGEIEIHFNARLESDVNGEWENHWLLKHFKEMYEERWIHDEVEKREKELWRDVYRIQTKVKQFLDLRSHVPRTPDFFPPKIGWES